MFNDFLLFTLGIYTALSIHIMNEKYFFIRADMINGRTMTTATGTDVTAGNIISQKRRAAVWLFLFTGVLIFLYYGLF